VQVVTQARSTGIDVVGDIPWGTYFCTFYETSQDLLDILIPYFQSGLENNECCVWVVSDAGLITIEEAKRALAHVVPDLDRQLADGNIEILSELEWYLEKNALNLERVKSAWDAKLKRAVARGYDGLRVSGDTFWLAQKDWRDFCEYEKQVNDSITGRRMTILCTYPLLERGAAEVLDVMNVHQFATARRQGAWQVIQSPHSIQAKAELKRLNEELQRLTTKTPEPPFILRYGVAVLAVIVALIINWLLNRHLVGAPAMLFLCAVMFSAWYGGAKPAFLAMPLAVLAFAYYFVTPINSWSVDVREIPRLTLFVLASVFVISLNDALKRGAESLRHARDVLAGTVEELKRTNEALRMENTERKQAEEAQRRSEDHLRLVIDSIPVMAWTLRPDGVVDFLNQRWIDYAGLSLEQYVQNPMGPIHPEDIERVVGKWRAAMAAGKGYEEEMRLQRADGKYRWFLVRTAPLRDESGTVVKWYGVSTDIDDRKRAEETLETTTEQLRALSRRLEIAKEEEAIRIARELHDELGSALTILKWDLARLGKEHGLPRERTGEMEILIDKTITSVRRISAELRPSMLDDLGATPAMQSYLAQFQERSGIHTRFETSLDEVGLTATQSIAVFRIFQEALTNVLRHAGATEVAVTMREEGSNFILTIADNGRGITEIEKSDAMSLGLLGMRERIRLIFGEIDVTGQKDGGTIITVTVPLTR